MALAGELPPLAGRVTCLGRDHRDPLQRRVRHGLGFVPAERPVFESLTVAANLRLGPGPAGAALDLFPELRPLLGRRAGLCSGGEQKILALAAAPRLLDALRAAADQRGLAVLLVEQHARQALQVAGRAYVLHRGQLAIDTAAALLDDTQTLERACLRGPGR